MKCVVQIGALGLTLHEDGEPINGINAGPTDPTYEARCIAFDAERAWKMQEPLERALSWLADTKQYALWMAAYKNAKEGI